MFCYISWLTSLYNPFDCGLDLICRQRQREVETRRQVLLLLTCSITTLWPQFWCLRVCGDLFLWVYRAFLKFVKPPEMCRWEESNTSLLKFSTCSSQIYFNFVLDFLCVCDTALVLTSWCSASLSWAPTVCTKAGIGFPRASPPLIMVSHFIMLLWVELCPLRRDIQVLTLALGNEALFKECLYRSDKVQLRSCWHRVGPEFYK